MIYLEKNDIHSTLTTWLYCHFWMLFSAEVQEYYNVKINWPIGKSVKSYEDLEKFKQIPNMYDWYFVQPKNNNPAVGSRQVWTWENWQDPTPVPLMSCQLTIIKQWYQQNLIFNQETNKRGQELVNKYQIDFSNTIGITWRGTDIYLDGRPRIPIEKYFRFIDEVLKPGMRIMCTAEESGILDPLLKRYPEAFFIEEFEAAPLGGKDNPERNSKRSGYERGLQPVLMVWLFSKCAHYIKNRSSTGAVASWLSNGRIVNIAHEETLSYVKMDDQVEIEGIKYPL